MKKLFALALVVTMVLALAGCGSQTAEKKDGIKVNVIVKALNSDYYKILQAGAMAAGKELGVTVNVIGPNSETDITGQTSMVEDSLIKKVSALVVAPSQPDAMIAALNKVKADGIPLLLVDSDANCDKISYIGTGQAVGGKMGGKYIADKVGKGAKAIILRGALGDACHDQRAAGALEGMKEGGVTVIATQPANSDRNLGMTVMENLLQANPDVKAVFATNDEMALGAVQALKQAGRKDIIVVGFDGSPDALKSIANGELTASVAQKPYEMGKQSVELAVKAAKGEKIPDRVDTGTSVIDKASVGAAQADLDKILGKK